MILDVTFQETTEPFVASFGAMTENPAAVKFTPQALSEAQKSQARKNIGVEDSLIINTASGNAVSINDATDRPLRGLAIYGKTTQNGTPTPSAPIVLESAGDSGSIAVSITGKNLINPAEYMRNLYETTLNGDVFTSNFQNGGSYVNEFTNNPPTYPKGTYTATFFPLTEGATCSFFIRSASTPEKNLAFKYGVTTGNASFTFTVDEDFFLSVGGSRPYGYQSYRLQLEVGTVSTAYEPYKAPQTLSIPTPNGLAGIPVASGGNYTDQNGQQWVCDEVDFARGVYVRRIERKIYNGDESWGVYGTESFCLHDNPLGYGISEAILCDRLPYGYITSSNQEIGIRCYNSTAYGSFMLYIRLHEEYRDMTATVDEFKAWLAENPLDVLIALTEPIETPLADMPDYTQLHINYPNTTVMADGAGVAVTYVADTKLYIDNKFTELQNAVLALGANI